jgi:hypothetical protein
VLRIRTGEVVLSAEGKRSPIVGLFTHAGGSPPGLRVCKRERSNPRWPARTSRSRKSHRPLAAYCCCSGLRSLEGRPVPRRRPGGCPHRACGTPRVDGG